MQKRSRILALDLLRGAFLIAIIVDHLGWGPSLFHLLSGGGRLFASPAEGFFAISGILVGYIYGPRMLKSFKNTTKKLWQRAFLLYALSVVFTLTYTAIAVSFPHLTGLPPLWPRDADSFLLNTLLGRYAYGWADFLPRYAVFMLVAPILLWLIVRGKAWVVAGASVVVYALFHQTPLLLPFSSWEIIFIPGIIIGYYLPALESRFANLRPAVKANALATVWTAAVVTFSLSTIAFIVFPMLGVESTAVNSFVARYGYLFDKETVAAGRLLLGIVWFAALYSFFRVYEQKINRVTLGVLETFGAKSLYTYGIHSIVVFILSTAAPVGGPANVADSTAIAAMVVVVMYVLVVSPHIAYFTRLSFYTRPIHQFLRYNRDYETARVRS